MRHNCRYGAKYGEKILRFGQRLLGVPRRGRGDNRLPGMRLVGGALLGSGSFQGGKDVRLVKEITRPSRSSNLPCQRQLNPEYFRQSKIDLITVAGCFAKLE